MRFRHFRYEMPLRYDIFFTVSSPRHITMPPFSDYARYAISFIARDAAAYCRAFISRHAYVIAVTPLFFLLPLLMLLFAADIFRCHIIAIATDAARFCFLRQLHFRLRRRYYLMSYYADATSFFFFFAHHMPMSPLSFDACCYGALYGHFHFRAAFVCRVATRYADYYYWRYFAALPLIVYFR